MVPRWGGMRPPRPALPLPRPQLSHRFARSAALRPAALRPALPLPTCWGPLLAHSPPAGLSRGLGTAPPGRPPNLPEGVAVPGTPDGDAPVQAAAEGARTPPQAQGRDSKYYDDPYPCPAEVAAKGAWEALRYRMKQYGLQGVLRHYGAWRYAVSLVPAYSVATGQLDLGHELGFAQLSPGTPSRPSARPVPCPAYAAPLMASARSEHRWGAAARGPGAADGRRQRGSAQVDEQHQARPEAPLARVRYPYALSCSWGEGPSLGLFPAAAAECSGGAGQRAARRGRRAGGIGSNGCWGGCSRGR